MITHKLNKLPKNTFQIDVTVPWLDIQKEYKTALSTIHSQFGMKGYRKGKVPMELAEKNIPKENVYQQVMRVYIPKIYDDVIKQENLKPIVSPKVDLKKAKENEEWEMSFTLAEKPVVNLKNYKDSISKLKAKNPLPASDIWVPGKDKDLTTVEQKQNDDKQMVLNSILDSLLKESQVEVSEMIIEEEVNQRLTKLVDDIEKLGLTTDNYLKSKNISMDDLKKQFSKEIEDMYRIEFILMAVADDANITIDQTDMEKLFGTIQDPKEKAAAQQNAYYYASILRKQKTLDYLTNL